MPDANELNLRKAYWLHVHACLVKFHGLTLNDAMEIVEKYKKLFPLKSETPDDEIIYHFEPFRLACKITGTRLSVKEFAAQYREILQIKSQKNGNGKLGVKGNLVQFGGSDSGSATKVKPIKKRSGGESASRPQGNESAISRPAAKSARKRAAGKSSPVKRAT